MPANSQTRRFAALAAPDRNGRITREKKRCKRVSAGASMASAPDLRRARRFACACGFSSLYDSHGVTVSAIASDSTMPAEALIGIGRMYGPIKPLTKAIGSSAAITVNVARIVGPPTSSTAGGIASSRSCAPRAMWRWMFSTTTMASSTRMPIEKISANSDTRLSVNPIAHEANRVSGERQHDRRTDD
jgi:ribosomal protein S27AE